MEQLIATLLLKLSERFIDARTARTASQAMVSISQEMWAEHLRQADMDQLRVFLLMSLFALLSGLMVRHLRQSTESIKKECSERQQELERHFRDCAKVERTEIADYDQFKLMIAKQNMILRREFEGIYVEYLLDKNKGVNDLPPMLDGDHAPRGGTRPKK